MKSLIFDAGPIISLATNGLLGVLEPLKKKFNGNFIIPNNVKIELVDNPLNSKRFLLESMQVMREIRRGNLKVEDSTKIRELSEKLCRFANESYLADGQAVAILQAGELDVLASAILFKADGMVVDERITRSIIETPAHLTKLLSRRLNKRITVNNKSLSEFKKLTFGLFVVRSTELMMIAYELGLLDEYLSDLVGSKKLLLEGVLWGLKLHGCSISPEEIEKMVESELKR